MADFEPEADLPAGPVDPVCPTSPPLYPPAKRLRSFVWEFFSYPKQPDGSIKDDREPTYKLCNKKVVARLANTSNMTSHLREWHKKEYAQLKSNQVKWIIINPTVAGLRCFIQRALLLLLYVTFILRGTAWSCCLQIYKASLSCFAMLCSLVD